MKINLRSLTPLLLSAALTIGAAPTLAQVVISPDDTSESVFDFANTDLRGRPVTDLALLFLEDDYLAITLADVSEGQGSGLIEIEAIPSDFSGELHLVLTPRPERGFTIFNPRFGIFLNVQDGIIESVPTVQRMSK